MIRRRPASPSDGAPCRRLLARRAIPDAPAAPAGRARGHHRRPGRHRRLPRHPAGARLASRRTTPPTGSSSSGTASTARSCSSRPATSPSSARTGTPRASSTPNCAGSGARRIPNDYGAAVINIADDVTDLVIANLTVRNDYGTLHDEHDHQFAIRSGGDATRISILHAKIIADGGDTLSLWNTASGMYYHADCDFEGWVDYVCPRGWAYVTNSRFFGHNLTASIWHDGSKDPDSKFVIRRSRVRRRARTSRSGATTATASSSCSTAGSRRTWRTGPSTGRRRPRRTCSRRGTTTGTTTARAATSPGSRTTCESADTAPHPRAVTRGGRSPAGGIPEATLPAGPARSPACRGPRTRTADVSLFRHAVCAGSSGRNATSHNVYFGTSNPPLFRGEPARDGVRSGAARRGHHLLLARRQRDAWRRSSRGRRGRSRPRPTRARIALVGRLDRHRRERLGARLHGAPHVPRRRS